MMKFWIKRALRQWHWFFFAAVALLTIAMDVFVAHNILDGDASEYLSRGWLIAQEFNPFTDAMYGTTELRLLDNNAVFGLFFLFCLFLGVSGTFWMQTSSRREEIGIMKSFGASSTCIVCTLIAEGVILAAVAVAIGCFLYLQYALKEGLYIPNNGEGDLLLGRYWFEHFSSHFAATSVVAFVIVAAVVCIGIYIPAHRISLVTPADALHDE